MLEQLPQSWKSPEIGQYGSFGIHGSLHAHPYFGPAVVLYKIDASYFFLFDISYRCKFHVLVFLLISVFKRLDC